MQQPLLYQPAAGYQRMASTGSRAQSRLLLVRSSNPCHTSHMQVSVPASRAIAVRRSSRSAGTLACLGSHGSPAPIPHFSSPHLQLQCMGCYPRSPLAHFAAGRPPLLCTAQVLAGASGSSLSHRVHVSSHCSSTGQSKLHNSLHGSSQSCRISSRRLMTLAQSSSSSSSGSFFSDQAADRSPPPLTPEAAEKLAALAAAAAAASAASASAAAAAAAASAASAAALDEAAPIIVPLAGLAPGLASAAPPPSAPADLTAPLVTAVSITPAVQSAAVVDSSPLSSSFSAAAMSPTALEQPLPSGSALTEGSSDEEDADLSFDIHTMTVEDRQQLALEWGYEHVGGGLPVGVAPYVLSEQLPEQLFTVRPWRLLRGILAPLCLVMGGYFLLTQNVSNLLVAAFQHVVGWLAVGTGYTGLFAVGQSAAQYCLIPDGPGMQDLLGVLLLAPALQPFLSWRMQFLTHVLQPNSTMDPLALFIPTIRQLSACSEAQVSMLRALSSPPLRLLGSIGQWLQSWDGLDLRRFQRDTRGAALFSWAGPLAFAGCAWPAMVAAGGLAGWASWWLMPWLVFHAWSSLLQLMARTAPHIPRYPPGHPEYDLGRAAICGTVTIQLPRLLEVLLNDANYRLPRHISPAIPFYHAREAHAWLSERLGPYLTEGVLNWQLLRNLLTHWQVYDNFSNTYTSFDEAISTVQEAAAAKAEWLAAQAAEASAVDAADSAAAAADAAAAAINAAEDTGQSSSVAAQYASTASLAADASAAKALFINPVSSSPAAAYADISVVQPLHRQGAPANGQSDGDIKLHSPQFSTAEGSASTADVSDRATTSSVSSAAGIDIDGHVVPPVVPLQNAASSPWQPAEQLNKSLHGDGSATKEVNGRSNGAHSANNGAGSQQLPQQDEQQSARNQQHT